MRRAVLCDRRVRAVVVVVFANELRKTRAASHICRGVPWEFSWSLHWAAGYDENRNKNNKSCF